MNDASSVSFSLRELAQFVGGTLLGQSDKLITSINRIDSAREGEITFLSKSSFAKFLPISKASVVLVSNDLRDVIAEHVRKVESGGSPALIFVPDAYRAFVKVMQCFFPPLRMTPGLRHPTAVIHEDAHVHETACIGPGCTIDAGSVIGERVMLYANVSLYENVVVGADTVVHANAVLGAGTVVGRHCIVHPGAVIGADGFGFLENADGSYDKIPQVGTVRLGDYVEVGANSTIDRAAVGATVIGNGVKLDNLVHVAHGVTIGDNTAIAAQAGISGSATLGKRNKIAGQVGIVGHITTTDDVIVEAQSGLSKSVNTPGAYFGSPAKDHRVALRLEAAIRQLPELLRTVRELEQAVSELQERAE